MQSSVKIPINDLGPSNIPSTVPPAMTWYVSEQFREGIIIVALPSITAAEPSE